MLASWTTQDFSLNQIFVPTIAVPTCLFQNLWDWQWFKSIKYWQKLDLEDEHRYINFYIYSLSSTATTHLDIIVQFNTKIQIEWRIQVY